jgi:hypothetical protein
MGEFTDLLDEVGSFEVPTKMERFLHREAPPSLSDQTLSYFAYSYELTFRHLAGAIKDRWHTNGLMQAPLYYLARHSIELHLKWAIEEFDLSCRPVPLSQCATPSEAENSGSSLRAEVAGRDQSGYPRRFAAEPAFQRCAASHAMICGQIRA